jgi:hypothetical protein
LNIYPNPSEGSIAFKIPANFEAQTIEIFDLSGRICKRLSFAEHIQLDLESGQYLVSIKSVNAKVLQQKLIIL